jgi:hypothetical protein
MQPMNQHYQTVREIDKCTMTDFIINLSYEMWSTVFHSNDSDTKFNSFLNTRLMIIYLRFPYKRIKI